MESYQTIEVVVEQGIVTIWLNRPEVHNAFNALMLQELKHVLGVLSLQNLRVLVIRGRGRSFCAGADLIWMKDTLDKEYQESYQESFQLAEFLQLLYHFPTPVITIAHGDIYGGGIGILAVADIAVCAHDAKFCFSEVSIGLVPAIISPYVVRRIGQYKAKELMLSANCFSGEDASRFSLVNCSVESRFLEETVDNFVRKLIRNSPEAMMNTKKMINKSFSRMDDDQLNNYTTEIITQARISKDGQEGMKAFLEKRKPVWK